ncbi:hypothetical protein HG536_0D03660 [Torulaspora globosa]|uniref:Uncharacterized protein n=1 Tax=Torulaspora globosa TaxID=48254 RepID=A0A7G3ZH58_9SACH|nr:uncharacterized protein HG536_0D03660 [Torulaspora globosa]QLL32844.1 hypothetical protein HG536_0D03660 [Torulaspora globosa]
MSKTDDGWNVVKLPEKGQLSSGGAVSDDYYVDDDDILSNTSSDDYADVTNAFNLGKKEIENVKPISDSYDTLTGSKNSGTVKSSSLEKCKNPDDDRRTTIMDKILSRFDNMRKPELKAWHVAILSSLVTVFIIVGTQRYFELFDGILQQKAGVSVTDNSSDKDLMYSNINFLNRDESVSPTWRPTGKYYVDFDNHIAYPLPQKEDWPWQKFKTDTVILWYTVRSKCRSWFKSKPVADFGRKCYTFVHKLKTDTLRIHNKILLARSWISDRLGDTSQVLKRRFNANLINLHHNSLVLKDRITETARSLRDAWNDQLMPRLNKFSRMTLRNANKSIKRCKYALLEVKSWVSQKSVPHFESFSKKVRDEVQRLPKNCDRKIRMLYSHLHRRESNPVVKRLSAHVKTCRHMTRRKCTNWQFSKIKVLNN